MANGGIIGKVNNPTSSTATGVWQQEEQYEAVRDGTWPEKPLFTTKSARFNDGSSDYLNITPGSDGSRVAWTFSTWIKRSALGAMPIFSTPGNNSNIYDEFYFNASDKIQFSAVVSGTQYALRTKRVFRDTSAWYHIVLIFNSNNSTAGDRMQLWINGVRTAEADLEDTTFKNAQNYNSATNKSGYIIYLSRVTTNTAGYYDGYMSEVIFQNAAVDSPVNKFGVANSDGVWTPIPFAGTYGTNGFNLQFENAAALGTDSSPNGNTFTVNNLTSIDQSTDYPEVNFATWNSLFRRGTITSTFTDGNLTSNFAGGAQQFSLTTFGVTTGKWYAEVKWISAHGNGATATGILDMAYTGTADPNNAVTNAFAYFGSGQKNVSGTASSYGASYGAGDIIGIALNCDNNQITFYKNGASQGVISIIAGVTYGIFGSEYDGRVASLNTGSPPYAISSGNADANGYGNFEYAVPSGYYSLNTKNLGEFG